MKDNARENAKDNNGDKLVASRNEPLASHTSQRRKTIIKGLRILARVAIRSYVREQAKQGPLNFGLQLKAYNAGE